MPEGAGRGRPGGDAVDAAVRIWVAERERAVREHPEPQELVDYQERRLDPAGAERLRRHLLDCPACRREVLDLHDLDRPEPEGSSLEPSADATEAGWRRFEAARAAQRSGPLAARPVRRTWPIAASIAAALAAGALAGSLLVGGGGPDPTLGAGAPFLFDLDPTGTAVLRDATAQGEIAVPPGMDPLVPRLNLGELTAHESYLVEVYDQRDRLVVRREGLARQRSGSVAFLVPRAELPAGRYQVRLIARDGEQSQELASYALRLRYET
jgi:hypothetical protein